MKNNILVKTIIFIIVIAIMGLLYFGLSSDAIKDVEILSFGFKVFSVFLIYLAAIVPDMFVEKVERIDLISLAIVYTIPTFILTELTVNGTFSTKELFIYNISLFLVCILILLGLKLRKKD